MIKRFFVAFLTVFIGSGLVIVEAEAKRMGGSRSIGMQRSITPQKAAPSPQKAQPAASPNAAPQASGWRRFAGPLAGLAAGLGLAALMSHLGLGAEFGSLLLALIIGGVIFFVLRRVFAKPQPQAASANGAPIARQAYEAPAFNQTAGDASAHQASLPADFDAEAFARQAKLNFIRLQAANDAGNLDDIRAFTTPEMFAEIKLDIDDRRGATQQTDVLDLSAEVLEVEETATQYIVSVRYSGLIREEADAAPASIDEVWHLSKNKSGSAGWLVAGIQQLN